MINLSSIFVLLGSLAMFMYGMKIMSEGLQKVAGLNCAMLWEQ